MKSHFLRQLDYDYWALSKLVDCMEGLTDLPERPADLLSHILAATHIWYSRLNGEVSPYAVWEKFEAKEWRGQLELNYNLIKEYLVQLPEEGFDKDIAYKTSGGVGYNTQVGDILRHVFWHSGYHQGQIVTQIKPFVQPLPDLNFINFARGK